MGMGWKKKLKLAKAKAFGTEKWKNEKQKAAVFLKLAEKMGGKQITHQHMKREWYRHIEKALRGETRSNDAKHWKKMKRTFKKQVVGVPSQETAELLEWLEGFEKRVENNQIGSEDMEKWLPQFESYMRSCEENAMDNYIIKNKMMEE
jgi:hypothetical protein